MLKEENHGQLGICLVVYAFALIFEFISFSKTSEYKFIFHKTSILKQFSIIHTILLFRKHLKIHAFKFEKASLEIDDESKKNLKLIK